MKKIMTVYHINKSIGPASSGIEYAQKYRADLLNGAGEDQLFIFCDYIYANYTRFTDHIGLRRSQTLHAYKFMAGQKNHPSVYTIKLFEKEKNLTGFEQVAEPGAIRLKKGNLSYKLWFVPDQQVIDRVDTIVGDRLEEVAHYSDRLTSIDYYEGREIASRYFFDESGQLSMRQFLESGKLTLTFLKDGQILQGQSAFYLEFFKRLAFSSEDILILDRNAGLAGEILLEKKDSKVVVVVHAEHFSRESSQEDWVLWNNYYDHVFTQAQQIDCFVTSTPQQATLLREQLAQMGQKKINVVAIPAGTILQVSDGSNLTRYKNKYLTVSRLAYEKHIDILIKAVVKAKEVLPDLTFHIYGAGVLGAHLRELTQHLKAEKYVIFEGHKPMNGEYEKYGGYLSASKSEGFGLSLLEALSACLPIIGLDVDYGNRAFVKSQSNGLLLENGDDEDLVNRFAKALIYLDKHLNFQEAIAEAKNKGRDYLMPEVAGKWQILLDELRQKGGRDT